MNSASAKSHSWSIDQVRNDTPACKSRIHFNNAGAGLMPRPVVDAIKAHLELEAEVGGYEAEEARHAEINRFYSVFAQLFHTQPSNLAFSANATDAYSRALGSIPFKPGDLILTSNDDYISNQIAFLSFKKRFGVDLIRVPNVAQGGVDLTALEALAVKHQPRLIAITHVPTNSGLVQPVAAIGEICRRLDILYLLDACQSVGQIDVNVNQIQCDFLTGTSRKWLRGPRGAGFMYVSDRVLEQGLEPLFIDMRGADWTGENAYQPQATARRFEDWESAYGLMIGTTEAAAYALAIGMDQITSRTQALAQSVRDRVASIPHTRVMDRGDELCGIVSIAIDGHDAADIEKVLRLQKINTGTSTRSSNQIDFAEKNIETTLRVSPHYYNTEAEIDRFMEVFETAIK